MNQGTPSTKEEESANLEKRPIERSDEIERATKEFELMVTEIEKRELEIEEKMAKLSRKEKSLNEEGKRLKAESIQLSRLSDELSEWATRLKSQEKELARKIAENKNKPESKESKFKQTDNRGNGGNQSRFKIKGDSADRIDSMVKNASVMGISFEGDQSKGTFRGKDFAFNFLTEGNEMVVTIESVPPGQTYESVARLIEKFLKQ